jgi:hypothetical protein
MINSGHTKLLSCFLPKEGLWKIRRLTRLIFSRSLIRLSCLSLPTHPLQLSAATSALAESQAKCVQIQGALTEALSAGAEQQARAKSAHSMLQSEYAGAARQRDELQSARAKMQIELDEHRRLLESAKSATEHLGATIAAQTAQARMRGRMWNVREGNQNSDHKYSSILPVPWRGQAK